MTQEEVNDEIRKLPTIKERSLLVNGGDRFHAQESCFLFCCFLSLLRILCHEHVQDSICCSRGATPSPRERPATRPSSSPVAHVFGFRNDCPSFPALLLQGCHPSWRIVARVAEVGQELLSLVTTTSMASNKTRFRFDARYIPTGQDSIITLISNDNFADLKQPTTKPQRKNPGLNPSAT